MYELPETFDPSRPNGHALACTEVPAYHLDIAPGDMTRYRLVVVPRPGGGLIVLWGEAVWFTSEEHGDNWLDPRTDRAASHNDHTRAAIVAILDEHVREAPDNGDAVIDLCCELALPDINATDDEDEQERLIEAAEARAVDILNSGDAEAFLREHGASPRPVVCECPLDEGESRALYTVTSHEGDVVTCEYCPTCAELAREDANGETASCVAQ